MAMSLSIPTSSSNISTNSPVAESLFRHPARRDGRSRATIRCCRACSIRCCCAAMRRWCARKGCNGRHGPTITGTGRGRAWRTSRSRRICCRGRSISRRSALPACSATPISASPIAAGAKPIRNSMPSTKRCWRGRRSRSRCRRRLDRRKVAMTLKLTARDLTIHRIVEQETTYLPALDMLPGLTPEVLAENKPWMRVAGAIDASDVLILCFQSYIVKTPHHTILVDSCIGNDKRRPLRPKWNMKSDDTYMRGLAAAGFAVGDIDFVMCTHLHVDHVGWNTRLENGRWVPTFPNARYVFGRSEFDYWTEQHARAPVPPFGDSVLPIVEADRAEIVRNDYAIGDHARIVPTPGHTPGHVAFTFGRGKDDAVVSGDLMQIG